MISPKVAAFGKAGKYLLCALAFLTAGYVSAAVEDEIRARIQPHGEVCVIGDPCADIGFFAAGTGAVDTILVRARTMAIHCQQDPQRAERWAVVWTVMDTASAWRDDQPALDLFLAGPDAQRLLDG